MKTRPLAAVAVVLVCAFVLPRIGDAAEAYLVDPAHTSVVFSVGHAQLSYVYGFFRKATGQYILDKSNPANCRFQFAVETQSIDTNNAQRDTHLRDAEFFNAQQFPAITFVSTSCALDPAQKDRVVYLVTGDLQIHGITRRVTVPLQMLGEGQGPQKDQRTGFLCQATLKRQEFGMTSYLDLVGDAVGVTISFEGVLQQGQPGSTNRTR